MTPDITQKAREEWRLIGGYEGLYEVSNRGNVRSVRREGARGGLLRCTPSLLNKYGYIVVRICLSKDNKKRSYSVARLVAKSFIPNPNRKKEVNHIDSNPQNNVLENLEWCTPQENTLHHHRSGRANILRGEAKANSKLTESSVQEILLQRGMTTAASLSRKYDVNEMTIRQVWMGASWKHIPRPLLSALSALKNKV